MSNYIVTIKDKKHNTKILDNTQIIVDGNKYSYELNMVSENFLLLRWNNKTYKIPFEQNKDNFNFIIDGYKIQTEVRTKLQEELQQLIKNKRSSKIGDEIIAPMPGLLLKILKKGGDKVKKGDAVLILEAMKMENEIRSPVDGTIKVILKKEGVSVEKGEKIIVIR